jgi:hypothetical protein
MSFVFSRQLSAHKHVRFILAASSEGSQGVEPKAIRCDGRFYEVDWLNLAGDSNAEQPGTAGFSPEEASSDTFSSSCHTSFSGNTLTCISGGSFAKDSYAYTIYYFLQGSGCRFL